ncbi:family transcriptional regulator [Leptolyngbya sp. Heron Island J]|uniref:TetR/AcrR family transcriptional regulator n=1 Tax=Leptolyngbya sp. Heron Island J TaxID=1385935 RepID=UPI0003B96C07|nr:TetR/AcrR family transcriptional regulator [Leptolyngbya sp. Heron Island J]ESA33933.1 family transcriptional regulator [Leptolyngbya sp. Heron Island J]
MPMSKTLPLRKRSTGGYPPNRNLEQRLEKILEASTQVFLEEGYGSATIGKIACEARVAKRTIYQYFGGKDELFGAVIHRLSNAVLSAFPSLDEEDTQSLEQVLNQFAYQLLMVVITPDAIGLDRLVISEASRSPELVIQFYDNGPTRAMSSLTDYLAAQAERGVIQLSNPTLSTECFINMVLGAYYPQMLLGIEAAPSSEHIKRHVNTTVQFFLNSCCLQSTQNL